MKLNPAESRLCEKRREVLCGLVQLKCLLIETHNNVGYINLKLDLSGNVPSCLKAMCCVAAPFVFLSVF